MEKKFKSLSIFEFQSRFSCDRDCFRYLESIKWAEGFKCPQCGCQKYCNGSHEFSRQCTRCSHIDSVTAGTIFHKCKFSLLKAFYIAFYLSTSKKGMASTELARKLQLRQKTCWLFKQKVMKAMESSRTNPMSGQIEISTTKVTVRSCPNRKVSSVKKKTVIVAIEKAGKGVKRIYARALDSKCKKLVSGFLCDFIHRDSIIKAAKSLNGLDLAVEYPHLKNSQSLDLSKNHPELSRTINLFSAWLRGIHHSVTNLQAYLNEYCFRFNRHLMKEGLFENLINRMVNAKPYPYKLFIN